MGFTVRPAGAGVNCPATVSVNLLMSVDSGTYLGGSHASYGSPLWVDSIVFSTVTVYCSRPKWIQ